MSEIIIAAKVLFLLWVTNGAPIIAARIFGKRFCQPIDAGLKLTDHQPLFGSSKTWRGIIAALICTVPLALAFGFHLVIALFFTLASIAGDLLSSFIKRRMKLAPSRRALFLDQIPEALLPVFVLIMSNLIDWKSGVLIVIGFVITDILLSRLLYRWHIRKRPY